MIIRRLLVASLVFLLAGCGFKLRGMIDMPPWFNHLAINNQGVQQDLERMLKDQLQGYNIHIMPTNAGASFLLVLIKDNIQQRLTNVGASTNPRQYQLIYTVRFKLIKNTGEVIVPEGQVSVTRQFTINNDRILGSSSEEATLYTEMRRDAASQIINRISHRLTD